MLLDLTQFIFKLHDSQTFRVVKTSRSTTRVYSCTTLACGLDSMFQALRNFAMMILFQLWKPMPAPWLILSVYESAPASVAVR